MKCFQNIIDYFFIKIRDFDSYLPWSNSIEKDICDSSDELNSNSDLDSPKKLVEILNIPNIFNKI